MSEKLLKRAAEQYPLENGHYAMLDLEAVDYRLPLNSDLIFCMGVICVIVDDKKLDALLDKCYYALKPNGLFITRDTFAKKEAFESTQPNGYHAHYRRCSDVLKTMRDKGFKVERTISLVDKGNCDNKYYIYRKQESLRCMRFCVWLNSPYCFLQNLHKYWCNYFS